MTAGVVLDQSSVDVDGVRTHFYHGGSGEPLVLVHGGQFGNHYSAHDWELNLPGLSRSFSVIAPDKLGQGFTDNPADPGRYVVGAVVAHLAGFIAALGLDGVHLVGHSRGSYAVVRLALDQPDLARTVIPVSAGTLMTHPNPIYDTWKAEARRFDRLEDQLRYLIEVNSFSPAHITPEHLSTVTAIMRLPKTRVAAEIMASAAGTTFRQDLMEQQERTQARLRAGELQRPVLIVWGYDDPSATMSRAGQPAMDLLFPALEVCEMHILNRAGHYCFREQPEAFNAVVTDFARRHRLARP